MPAINFKAEYAAKILEGSKPFTLRKRRVDYRDPAPMRSTIALYTGMRTKSCRHFASATCAMRGLVRFTAAGLTGADPLLVMTAQAGARDGMVLEQVKSTVLALLEFPNGPRAAEQRERLASWDGFASWADMWAFHEAYGLDDDGVAVRELIGFAHVTATTGGADA